MNNIELSMFMPSYEEEVSLRKSIPAALDYLSRVASRYELMIILDERSRDDSYNIIRSFCSHYPQLRLVLQSIADPGYGRALALGFREARFPLIFYTDADNQYMLSDLEKMLLRLEETDMIIGYRLERKDPLLRLWTAKLYNHLVHAWFGLNVRDIDCSFKLLKKKVVEARELRCRSGAIEIELLLLAREGGFRFIEVPVEHRPRTSGVPSFELGRGKFFGIPSPGNVLKVWREMRALKRRFR